MAQHATDLFLPRTLSQREADELPMPLSTSPMRVEHLSAKLRHSSRLSFAHVATAFKLEHQNEEVL